MCSCKQLREAAEARKHVVNIIDPILCYMNINSSALRCTIAATSW
ncbi:MAG: hypothetical protein ACR5LD_02975 [Symbiopectobacterium sp.]